MYTYDRDPPRHGRETSRGDYHHHKHNPQCLLAIIVDDLSMNIRYDGGDGWHMRGRGRCCRAGKERSRNGDWERASCFQQSLNGINHDDGSAREGNYLDGLEGKSGGL